MFTTLRWQQKLLRCLKHLCLMWKWSAISRHTEMFLCITLQLFYQIPSILAKRRRLQKMCCNLVYFQQKMFAKYPRTFLQNHSYMTNEKFFAKKTHRQRMKLGEGGSLGIIVRLTSWKLTRLAVQRVPKEGIKSRVRLYTKIVRR